ncbi:hypothetical protein M409DRAFT_29943 [Zasmidium cellare ATCC 36951]|uniref:histidine kinase n=1 Tax=Zasmidium cellare ATCC 36951 TaxID=1080233 RepID=A0A6A6BXT7_ZASCE|nr:uncharacterized protein M409DRAFT_29943 [Zasmidium cellare ATCC 36951]KAF2159624.1 hypothetical protein M409DRAFT_29943 [Zasmidium cellare ATCC 36951]
MKDTSQSNTDDAGIHQLPGDDHVWHNCALGPFQDWPSALKAHVLTVSNLPYPAAILWGNQYILLHNHAWQDAAEIHQQGLPQRDSLSPAIVDIFRSVAEGRIPKEVQSRDLIKEKALAIKQASTAILSPLLAASQRHAEGILVQLLPQPMLYQSLQLSSDSNGANGKCCGNECELDGDVARTVDNTPIDEHPFFRRFAEMLPSGLAILDKNAQAVFVNQHFYDLTTSRNDHKAFTSWPQSIHPDDYDRVMQAYQEAFASQKQLRTEFRAMGAKHPWRLLLLTPLGDENLQHVSLREYGGFICSIVDITSEKSAEISEREAANQARERKQTQERFLDMISHEIRNPLSAVLHCAEEISDAVRDNKQIEGIAVNIIREAVETIHLCVTHQKNIVDDVLSFSKLDASLLSLKPKPSQPSRQLASTLKMFQHEFRKENLKFGATTDDTYQEYNVDWVLADIARISQVLINLITNAIKFTNKVEGQRQVHCYIGASKERPPSYPRDVVYFESDSVAYKMDATNSTEWGSGDPVYITVAVKDTGIGISAEGQKRLFERFRQATPRTEEVYGGSGLGLNISRKICHLHGGEIGVSSKEGEGSTFAFYFRARRIEGPPDGQDDDAGKLEDEDNEEKVKEKIHELREKNPDETISKEPFAWTSGDKESPQQKWSKKEQLESIRSPTNEDGNAAGKGGSENAVRPSLSTVQQGSEKMVSRDVGSEASPGVDEPDRPVTSFNQQGSRAHVLLVEDNIINQKILYRKLEAKGFNVTTANNGQEAVEAAKSAPRPDSGEKSAFDVILMDNQMPVMDGNEAARAIRKFEKDSNLERIPILGVTANVRGAQQDEMMESGMDDVMSKPYKIEDLVAKISEFATNARENAESGKDNAAVNQQQRQQ